MSKRKSTENDTFDRSIEDDNVYDYDSEDEHTDEEVLFVPNDENSDVEGLNSDDENDPHHTLSDASISSYEEVYRNFSPNDKKLEESHSYKWLDNEKAYNSQLDLEIFNFNAIKQKVLNKSPRELFEMFFCDEMKNQIIDSTKENHFDMDSHTFNQFLGIIIFSIFNIRKSYRDYWATDEMLHSDIVSNTMSRNIFENIKSHLKTSKDSDKVDSDKVWKVRVLLNIFRKNIQQFGFFCSSLSIDEMMIKFFGRTVLKQFIKDKPIRFGIKLWALCTSNGFVLELDIYCGKNDGINDAKFSKCSLGSRAVMKMLYTFLITVSKRDVSKYHLYFDRFFTSPDLLVHLKKQNLRATGTVRDDRVFTNDMFPKVSDNANKKSKKKTVNPEKEKLMKKHKIDKNKAGRGFYVVSHEENSGMNYITVMDSKPVSILSTALGVTPTISMERFDKTAKGRVPIQFPGAFKTYNKFMGGVDLHDQYCSDMRTNIGSKKWTWVVLCRLIQSSLTNALILYNMVNEKKMTSKDFAESVANSYLESSSEKLSNHLKLAIPDRRRVCIKCTIKTIFYCFECKKHFCDSCFRQVHNIHQKSTKSSQRICKAYEHCKKRTNIYCNECEEYICASCFDVYHTEKNE